MAEPAHSLDMNEECCNDILTYCPREACTLLLHGKCFETIYLLDKKHYPTYNGTLLQVSWHPVGHPIPDYEDHRRCLLSQHCERMLCQVQDATVPHCDPEILPHICPSTTVPPTTYYQTTPLYIRGRVSNVPGWSAESAQSQNVPGLFVPGGANPYPQAGYIQPAPSYMPPHYPRQPNFNHNAENNRGHNGGNPSRAPVPSDNPVPVARPTGRPARPQENPYNPPKRPIGSADPRLRHGGYGQQRPPPDPNLPPRGAAPRNPPPLPDPTPEEPNINVNGGVGPQPNDQSANIIRESNQVNTGTDGNGNGNPLNPSNNIPPINGPGEQMNNQRTTTEAAIPAVPFANTGGSQQNQALPKPKQPSSVKTSIPKIVKPKKAKPKDANNVSNQNKDTPVTNPRNVNGFGNQAGIGIQGRQPAFNVSKFGGSSGLTTDLPGVTLDNGNVENSPDDGGAFDVKILAGGIVGGALLALLMVCLTVCCVKRRKNHKSSAASTTSSHRGLHLQYSGFPLEGDMLHDPVCNKSSLKSINGPPPIPYRPPATGMSYVNSFREPTKAFVGSRGGISFGEEPAESNDYEELPCDVDLSPKETYEELTGSKKEKARKKNSTASEVSPNRHVRIHTVPTLYAANRDKLPKVTRRQSSGSILKATSQRHSNRPLPARPTDSLPANFHMSQTEEYEPIEARDGPPGYEIPVNVNNANLAMLGLLNYPQRSSRYGLGTETSQSRRQSLLTSSQSHGLANNSDLTESPDYFVLERQDDMVHVPLPSVSQGVPIQASGADGLTYAPGSDNSYAEVGHEYLDLERSAIGLQASNHHLPHDIHL